MRIYNILNEIWKLRKWGTPTTAIFTFRHHFQALFRLLLPSLDASSCLKFTPRSSFLVLVLFPDLAAMPIYLSHHEATISFGS